MTPGRTSSSLATNRADVNPSPPSSVVPTVPSPHEQDAMPGTRRLSVVVPTFNERENLKILIPSIDAVFLKNGIDGEIIIVDDRSTDGSAEVLKEPGGRLPKPARAHSERPPPASRAHGTKGSTLPRERTSSASTGTFATIPTIFRPCSRGWTARIWSSGRAT